MNIRFSDHHLLNPRRERAEIARVEKTWLEKVLPTQCLDGSENDGGFHHEWPGWLDGRHAAYTLAHLMAVRSWSEEIAQDTARVDQAIQRAILFLHRRQHPDGRLDLLGAYSPNEAGFPMPPLIDGYESLGRLPGAPLGEAGAKLKEFLLRGAEAVLAGSAYTANHRWTAACAPLAAVHSLWPDPRYLAKIEAYLADGLDCDADGCWFEERSPNYNMVANSGLIMLADRLKRPELLDAVIRNLHFVLHGLQPNGEIDSSFSLRQDRAAANCRPATYAVARRVAQITGDGRFTALALHVWENYPTQEDFLLLPFELDRHPQPMPPPQPPPSRYEKHFAHIGVIRRREEQTSLTLAADRGGHFYDTVRDQWGGPKRSDDWFHLFHRDIVIQSIHLAAAQMGNVQPMRLRQVSADAYELDGFSRGWTHTLHFRPGNPKLPIDWNWSHRIRVTRKADEIGLAIESESDHSLVASLGIYLRPGVIVREGAGPERELRAGETIHLRGGHSLLVRSAQSGIEIEGLPPARHDAPLQQPGPIPSGLTHHCGCLSLGLRFPVRIAFRLVPQ